MTPKVFSLRRRPFPPLSIHILSTISSHLTARAASSTSETHPCSKVPRDANANYQPSSLPHLTTDSEIHIIPISAKSPTYRTATAAGRIAFSNATPYDLIRSNSLRKGDVLAVARVAGVMAAKKTADWIPLCHSGIGIEGVKVVVELVKGERIASIGLTAGLSRNKKDMRESQRTTGDRDKSFEHGELEHKTKDKEELINSCGGVRIEATVQCFGKTGVEMEAVTAVVGAALTVVDMCKGVDRGCRIEGVRVVRKEGGRSGLWKEDGWDQ